MHHASRILLCRTGFVLFCLLPTLIVGLWIVCRSTGDYASAQRDEWQRGLTSRLGLAVEIGAVSYPTYAVARLEAVHILDPETGVLIAQVPVVEVIPTSGGWQIEAWQPQIEAAQLAELARALNERLLRGPADSLVTCELLARDLTLAAGPQSQTFADVSCRLDPLVAGPELTLAAGPLRLTIARNRQQSPPVTRWQFDTAGQSVPCALLSHAWPQLARLGSDCRFAGGGQLIESPAGLSGELAGTLDRVDLDSLVTEQFPHQLSGLATIRLQRATLEGDKLTELRGTLQAQNGAISPSLLSAAAEHLELAAPANLLSMDPSRAVPFRQLSLGFHLSGRTLQLTGSADATQSGALLANAGGPLLGAPPRHATAAVNLLRTLLPDNQYQVPATRQSDALIGLLPVPDQAPARTARGHTPTRLVPSTPGNGPAIRQPGLR